jgi:hypothetical protein
LLAFHCQSKDSLTERRKLREMSSSCPVYHQDCQMDFFKPKIPIWVNFGGPKMGKCWYVLRPFGIFYEHLGNFMNIWYNLCSFGTFFRFWYHAPRKIWQPCLPRASVTDFQTLDRSLQKFPSNLKLPKFEPSYCLPEVVVDFFVPAEINFSVHTYIHS